MALRSQKQALSMLLQRGSVGDDLWQRFLRAEKEMEDEVRDVVTEVGFLYFLIERTGGTSELTGILGKCLRSQLGPNNLPVRERNGEQYDYPGAVREASE